MLVEGKKDKLHFYVLDEVILLEWYDGCNKYSSEWIMWQ